MTLGTVQYKLGDTVKLTPVVDTSVFSSPVEPLTLTLEPADSSRTNLEWITQNFGDATMSTFNSNNTGLQIEGTLVEIDDTLNALYLTVSEIGSWQIDVNIGDGNSANIYSDSYAMSGSKRFISPNLSYDGQVIDLLNIGTTVNLPFSIVSDSNSKSVELEITQSSSVTGDYVIDRSGTGTKKVGKLSIPIYKLRAGERQVIDSTLQVVDGVLTNSEPTLDFTSFEWQKYNFLNISTDDQDFGIHQIIEIKDADTIILDNSSLNVPQSGIKLDLIEYYLYGKKSEVASYLNEVALDVQSWSTSPFNLNFTLTDSGGQSTAVVQFTDGIYIQNLSFPSAVREGESYSIGSPDLITSESTVTLTFTLSDSAAGSFSTNTIGSVTSSYNSSTGVWEASGAIADVEALAADTNLSISANYLQDFSVDIVLSDGVNPNYTDTANISEVSIPTNVSVFPTTVNVNEKLTFDFNNLFNSLRLTDPDNNNWTLEVQVDPAFGVLSGSVNMSYDPVTGILSRGPINNLNSLEDELTVIQLDVVDDTNQDFTGTIKVDDGVFGFNGETITFVENSDPVGITVDTNPNYLIYDSHNGVITNINDLELIFQDDNPQANLATYTLKFIVDPIGDTSLTTINGSFNTSDNTFSYTDSNLNNLWSTTQNEVDDLSLTNPTKAYFDTTIEVDNGAYLNSTPIESRLRNAALDNDVTYDLSNDNYIMPYVNGLSRSKIGSEIVKQDLTDKYIPVFVDSNPILTLAMISWDKNTNTITTYDTTTFSNRAGIDTLRLNTFVSNTSSILTYYLLIEKLNDLDVVKLEFDKTTESWISNSVIYTVPNPSMISNSSGNTHLDVGLNNIIVKDDNAYLEIDSSGNVIVPVTNYDYFVYYDIDGTTIINSNSSFPEPAIRIPYQTIINEWISNDKVEFNNLDENEVFSFTTSAVSVIKSSLDWLTQDRIVVRVTVREEIENSTDFMLYGVNYEAFIPDINSDNIELMGKFNFEKGVVSRLNDWDFLEDRRTLKGIKNV